MWPHGFRVQLTVLFVHTGHSYLFTRFSWLLSSCSRMVSSSWSLCRISSCNGLVAFRLRPLRRGMVRVRGARQSGPISSAVLLPYRKIKKWSNPSSFFRIQSPARTRALLPRQTPRPDRDGRRGRAKRRGRRR